MKQLSLTIFELIYLGSLTGQYMHAVPNVYSELSEHDASESRQAAMDSLLAKGFIEMDFDGEITIGKKISHIVRFCGACDGYFLLSINRTDGDREERVVWRKDGQLLQAEIRNTHFLFSETTQEEFLQYIRSVLDDTAFKGKTGDIQLTLLALKKAKQSLRWGEQVAEKDLLPKAGEPEMINGILDALAGRADLIAAGWVDLLPHVSSVTHLISKGSCGYMEITPVVEQYRSAAVFSGIHGTALKEKLIAEAKRFAYGEG